MSLPSLSELLKFSTNQINGYTKQQLVDILAKAEKPNEGPSLAASIGALTQEIMAMRKSLDENKAETKKEIEALRQQVSKQHDIIAKQQLYLEQLDRRERECNLVLLGVPEDSEALEGATNDDDKVQKVWEAAGISCNINSTRRIGNTSGSRRRPILVVVESRAARDAALETAKNLKNSTETFKKIYVKKDVHPSVRAEWRRLHEVVQREKSIPGNSEFNIYLDFKQRKVYKDTVVIDQWSMQGF